MKKKKRGKRKNQKIDYLNFNKGTSIVLIGLVLFILNFVYKILFLRGASIEITSYLQLISFILIYFGLIFHLIFIGDKPFSKSYNYIKKSVNFIYVVLGVFFIFVLIGFFVPAPDAITEQILKFIQELLEKTENMPQGELIRFIFLNNIKSSFFAMVLGILLGIFPMIAVIANGYLLGFVASMVVGSEGILSMWRILPHGIFELPAIFISLGLGLKVGFPFVQRYVIYFYKKRNYFALISLILFLFPSILITLIFSRKLRKIQLGDFNNRFWNSIRVFIFIVLPLLIIAAIIEGSFIFLFG